ncbi:MAG: hypothetical protein JNL79_37680 [Myxococcales bacterium]|nr:hypothetical protein [Myxococcales bacterium]
MATKKAKGRPLTRKSGWLSIWAGHFDSLDELERHVDSSEFEKQHGFVIEPPLLPFNAFLDGASPAALVGLLSKDEQLAAKVVAAIGVEPTNALLLHEECVFDAALSPRGKKRMRFLGSWPKPR